MDVRAQQAPATRGAVVVRGAVLLALAVFGVFCLMLAVGAASFVGECQGIVCGQLHQAVFAVVAAGACGLAASRLLAGAPGAAAVVLLGTLPLLVVHVALVLTDPDESTFFPLSTAPPPALAALALLAQRLRRPDPAV